MSNRIKKRFIAGAICPSCKSMDTLMLYKENNVEQVRCVQCDYHKSQVEPNVEKSTRAEENVIGIFKPGS